MGISYIYVGNACQDCGGTSRYIKGNRCVECTRRGTPAKRAQHNQIMRAGQLRRKFGITVDQYDAIAESQDMLCAICRKVCVTDRKLAVDHCHETDDIRGLLCQNCNIGLGKFQDDPVLLQRAAEYVLGGGGRTPTISGINRARKTPRKSMASSLTEMSATSGVTLVS